ncbi:QWRF motif-containing protein 2-like [Phalaenopsis equestris]|uniref:QWRF motif-containing protein 2-like n=1 Tax=Phalaenopsis equestris TaxID=78828 RepID=UPI0009E599B6|nr:QWRF motif-containing protein 2-like [Phalaenopsis equestris]
MVAVVAVPGCGEEQAFPRTPSSLPPSERGFSRCLPSSLLSSSKSNSSSSSLSSSSSSTPQRFRSPLHNPTSQTPSTLSKKRSQSVDRLQTSTRSLSVSFQGESFVFQTSKSKPTPRKPISESRKPIVAFTGVDNSQPNEKQRPRYPTARAREANSLTRSLNCSVDRDNPILLTVRLLLDEANFNIGDPSQSSDSDSLSYESNAKVRAKPRGICVPARFMQENGCPLPHVETTQKLISGKQQPLANTQLPSPKIISPAPYGPKFCLPRQDGASRTRRNIMENYSNGHVGNAPSIISFASEVRRTKKGESRIENAHMLRLFHNRYLQWRYINARAENAFSTHLVNAKNNLYDACLAISELHDLAMNKQIKLEELMRNLKLASLLKGQINYLDEWSTLSSDHENSLRGIIEALKASTLRLPVIGGAKMDIQEVKDAINSTVGVMQALTASICCLLSKVEEISCLASEIAKAAACERALLDQSKDLLSVVSAMHVKQCSVQACILQLAREASLIQLQ